MLKQPIWLAMLLLFGGYVAFGSNSCERADRAVMPIHWVGQSANYLFNNLSSSTSQKSSSSPMADKTAGWLRDFILVAAAGGGTCSAFSPEGEEGLKANSQPTKSVSTGSSSNDGKPVFYTKGQ